MSRKPRLALALVAATTLVAGCSSSPVEDGTAPSYRTSDDVQARVLPQLAATGTDVEAADDASWVVDATIDGADEGTTVTLLAKAEGGDWESVSDAETDEDGRQAQNVPRLRILRLDY